MLTWQHTPGLSVARDADGVLRYEIEQAKYGCILRRWGITAKTPRMSSAERVSSMQVGIDYANSLDAALPKNKHT